MPTWILFKVNRIKFLYEFGPIMCGLRDLPSISVLNCVTSSNAPAFSRVFAVCLVDYEHLSFNLIAFLIWAIVGEIGIQGPEILKKKYYHQSKTLNKVINKFNKLLLLNNPYMLKEARNLKWCNLSFLKTLNRSYFT